jgi:hypothetical protein
LRYLRLYAHGIKFNDMKPRPAPKAAKTTLPDNSSYGVNTEQQRERDGHAAGSAENLDTYQRSAQSGRTLQLQMPVSPSPNHAPLLFCAHCYTQHCV